MSEAQKTVRLEFEDNTLMTIICGQHNQHLARIEQALNVSMDSFGNQIKISGLPDKVDMASKTFTSLYQQLSAQDNQDEISATLVDDVLRQTENGVNPATTPIDKSLFATTWKKKIFPRTVGQAAYFKLLRDHEVVFGLGPAGTGKTYMAVAWAVDFLKRRQVERIILSRPAVEAGERLGFLPGDMKEKVDPLYPIQPINRIRKAGKLATWQINLAKIARDCHARILAQTGQYHFHLNRGGVLCLINNHKGIG